MAYQSLYRRYRPQRFGEIRGQDHVVAALQNAVVKGEVGHAYLFHGPRGTGKTTSARVLAKALNCENLGADGEPCGECDSCVAIEQGRSFDLHELDAASNNKVEDMRDLLGKVNLGNPGRAKVYILDEVHMLTSQAENALLKTLEEPPDHVTWVLATTEPHKVVETIRSRCQVFELSLLGADVMADHVRWVIDDAGLEVGEEAVDHVVAAGGGSARDTLSALDRVVAAGGVVEVDTSTSVLLDALADRDVAAALAAVGDATGRGRDPRTIGENVLAGLRDTFLTAMGSPPPRLGGPDAERAAALATRMSAPTITRALEVLGVALVEMRQAPDPRVDLEVALVRLCRPETDRSVDALNDRVAALEARLAGGAAPASPAASAPAGPVDTAPPAPAASAAAPPPVPAAAPPSEPAPEPTPAATDESADESGPAAAARRVLADKRSASSSAARPSAPAAAPAPPPPPPPVPVSAASESASSPSPSASVDLRSLAPQSPSEVVQLAGEHLGIARDRVVKRAADLLGPSDGPRSGAELSRLWLVLVDEAEGPESGSAPVAEPASGDDGDPGPTPPDDDPGPTPPDDDPDTVAPQPDSEPAPAPSADEAPRSEESIDLHDLVDAPSHTDQIIEHLTEAFPGAELHVTEESDNDE